MVTFQSKNYKTPLMITRFPLRSSSWLSSSDRLTKIHPVLLVSLNIVLLRWLKLLLHRLKNCSRPSECSIKMAQDSFREKSSNKCWRVQAQLTSTRWSEKWTQTVTARFHLKSSQRWWRNLTSERDGISEWMKNIEFEFRCLLHIYLIIHIYTYILIYLSTFICWEPENHCWSFIMLHYKLVTLHGIGYTTKYTIVSESALPQLLRRSFEHKVLTIGVQHARVGALLEGGFWFAHIFCLRSEERRVGKECVG